MISNAYLDYINNSISYVHILPFDEQIRKCNTFLDYFINNQDQIFANKKQYKIFLKVMYLIDMNIISKNEMHMQI